jgi:hypothetical protein
MRKLEPGLADRDIIVGEEIDVDWPRPPVRFAGTVAPERAFDLLCTLQQAARREIRFNRDT